MIKIYCSIKLTGHIHCTNHFQFQAVDPLQPLHTFLVKVKRTMSVYFIFTVDVALSQSNYVHRYHCFVAVQDVEKLNFPSDVEIFSITHDDE